METKFEKKNKSRRKTWCILAVILSLVFILLGYILLMEIQRSEKKKEMECQAYFLDDINISDESFNALSNFKGDDEICIFEMEKKSEKLLKSFKRELLTQTDHPAVITCIENRLQDLNYFNKLLLLEVIDYARFSWKFWKYFERTTTFKSLKESIEEMKIESYNYCKVKATTLIEEYSGDGPDDDYLVKRMCDTQKVQKISNDEDLYFDME